MSKFSEWLEAEMKARQWNNKSLAVSVGASNSTVGTWINNGQTPEPKFLIKLAELFGKNWDWVFQLAFELPAAEQGDSERKTVEDEQIERLAADLMSLPKDKRDKLLAAYKNIRDLMDD